MRRAPYLLLTLLGVVVLFASIWSVFGSDTKSTGQALAVVDPSLAAEAFRRSDDGAGQVQLSATLITASGLKEESVPVGLDPDEEIGVFVELNTHSVPLDGYDLTELSSLSSAAGESRPLRYLPQNDALHHRSGLLVFSLGEVELGEEGEISFSLRGVGGVRQRLLTWQLPFE